MSNVRFSFKSLFWSCTFAVLPFMLLFIFLTFFNLVPVYFNDQPYYGFKGALIAILMIPSFGLIMGSMNWMFLNFGNYLYQKTLKLLGKNEQ